MGLPGYLTLSFTRAVNVLFLRLGMKHDYQTGKQPATAKANITDKKGKTTRIHHCDDMAPRYPSLEGMEIAIPPYDHRDSGFSMAEYERTATADGYDTRPLPPLPRPLRVKSPSSLPRSMVKSSVPPYRQETLVSASIPSASTVTPGHGRFPQGPPVPDKLIPRKPVPMRAISWDPTAKPLPQTPTRASMPMVNPPSGHRSVVKARKVMGCEVDIHDSRSGARIPSEPSRVHSQDEDARPRMDPGERRFYDKRAAREYHRFATSMVDERPSKPNSTPSHVQRASSPGRALATHSDGTPRPKTSWGPERPLSAFESDSEDDEAARLMASIRGFFCNGAKCVGNDEETGERGGRSLFGKAREWHAERTKARRREEMKRAIRTSHGE
ncbi:uncharacterized protein F5Z01DRAFT_644336 [Emericellopsis atlantica]|uniref:Uncharacterized protein n=1 Tax=Emericellopsis atlantica TaxID=2614577 RepID=A0A9P7ZT65_9HYPO|nr:uncharacterized protein F5Z01DRAFT_644336 [Emericellopsis atlantica]KAG9257844.1 hypothetical protein F5Z01DRAFT_644336 [Emericellopsis atlantica]